MFDCIDYVLRRPGCAVQVAQLPPLPDQLPAGVLIGVCRLPGQRLLQGVSVLPMHHCKRNLSPFVFLPVLGGVREPTSFPRFGANLPMRHNSQSLLPLVYPPALGDIREPPPFPRLEVTIPGAAEIFGPPNREEHLRKWAHLCYGLLK